MVMFILYYLYSNINGNGTDPNVQPAGLVWQTEIAVAYAYALVLVVWSQIDVTP